ncbi:hypothetical protein Tco_0513303 [Tanacetum coccineum]
MWKQQNDSLIAQLNRKTCEVKDLKSQLQEKKLEINKVKERLNKIKGKPVDTKFEKPLVGRQPTTFKFQKPLVLGNCLHSLTLLREKSFQSPEQELLQIVRSFHACKQEEGQSVSSYVLKMKRYIDNLEHLGHPVSLNLATVNELHAMLKLHEQTLPKKDVTSVVMAIKAGRI